MTQKEKKQIAKTLTEEMENMKHIGITIAKQYGSTIREAARKIKDTTKTIRREK